MADTKAKLTLNGDSAIELDVLKGTLGQDVIDIRSLGSKGMFTFDPGFTSTASCESKITFIDGDEGILLHRGFPIDQLATESNYLEVCYILLYGEKPTQAEYDEFKTTVTRHTMIHEQITRLFHGFRRDSHPMAVMCGVTGALLTSCIISASAPTANNTVMFAAKYGRDTGLSSKVVAVITFLSILTMPLMIALSQTI